MTDPVAELAVQIEQTRAFIDSNPVTLELVPHLREPDGKGGKRTTALPPRPPQVLRMVESNSLRSNRRITEVGEQWEMEATLLGMPDAQVAIDDTFPWNGDEWRVEEISFPNGYEVRASVIRLGR